MYERSASKADCCLGIGKAVSERGVSVRMRNKQYLQAEYCAVVVEVVRTLDSLVGCRCRWVAAGRGLLAKACGSVVKSVSLSSRPPLRRTSPSQAPNFKKKCQCISVSRFPSPIKQLLSLLS